LKDGGAMPEILRFVYTLPEAADALGCSAKYLADQCRARAVPARKVAGSYKFTEADLWATLDVWAVGPAVQQNHVPSQRISSMTPTTARRMGAAL
jgi:hypothetical protein